MGRRRASGRGTIVPIKVLKGVDAPDCKHVALCYKFELLFPILLRECVVENIVLVLLGIAYRA